MKNELRFGIIGTGFWSRFQLAAWQEIQGARCVALCNRTRSKAEALGREFGISGIYSEAGEMFDRESDDDWRPEERWWAEWSPPPLRAPGDDRPGRAGDDLIGVLMNEIETRRLLARVVYRVPDEWLKVVRNSIRTVTPRFSARRMLVDYLELAYAAAYQVSAGQRG